jgi:hypothetical protein
VLNGVAEGEDTTLGLSLITNVRVLLTHTNHDTASKPLALRPRCVPLQKSPR